jgi:hypothetical protein
MPACIISRARRLIESRPRPHRIVAGDLLPDASILDRRFAVQLQIFGKFDEQVEVRAEAGAVGRDIALDHQRRQCDRKAAADRRHAVIVADLHVVEEDLVDVAVAAREFDRTNGHARRLHVDPEIGEALVLRDRRVGAHDDDAIVAILRPARPDLLAVNLPPVAVGLGAGAQARKVGAAEGSEKSWHQISSPFSALMTRSLTNSRSLPNCISTGTGIPSECRNRRWGSRASFPRLRR